MTSLADEATLARYDAGEDRSSGKVFSLPRGPLHPVEKGYLKGPSCHSCYRPLSDKRVHYCDSCKQSGAAGRHARMVAR